MVNPLLEKFGQQKRWVTWKLEERKGKKTKLPYGLDGKLASSTDPSTWATYEEAYKVSKNVGITFASDQLLLGIDIDHCLDENGLVKHEKAEIINRLVSSANSYTEISPSGEGLHIFLVVKTSLSLSAHKKAPFEVYTSGRYFTFTGKPWGGVPISLKTVKATEALEILEIIGYPWKEEEAKSIVNLDDSDILKKMFKSKHGKDLEALYNGSLTGRKDDASAADLALCSHLAFWTRKDASQIERIWTSSPLGQREKTQKRRDYRASTVNKAIKGCKEIYETPAMKIELENPEIDLLYTLNPRKEKVFTLNTENICRVLQNSFRDLFRYDVFRNVIEQKKNDVWKLVQNHDVVDIQTKIQIQFSCFGKVGKLMVEDAIVKIAHDNEIDSALDYIKSIVWDRESRLDTWLCKTYGVEKSKYYKAVGSNWLKGMILRLIRPGSKFDYVLVLEGPQGSRKSSSLAVLGSDWHVETAMSTESKDFFMQFQGKSIIEFSEGETLSRTEVKRMKAIITMQSDRFRPPYERTSQDFPRRCVFAMTTNQEEYLKDETGNRRWLPVKLVSEEADIEWLQKNREQLFAEAYYRVVEKKETVYEFPKEETLAIQEARRIHDPNEDLIADWYSGLKDEDRDIGITIHQVYRSAIHGNMPGGQSLPKWQEMAISSVLKDKLKLVSVQCRRDGIRSSRWFPPNYSPLDLDLVKIESDDIDNLASWEPTWGPEKK